MDEKLENYIEHVENLFLMNLSVPRKLADINAEMNRKFISEHPHFFETVMSSPKKIINGSPVYALTLHFHDAQLESLDNLMESTLVENLMIHLNIIYETHDTSKNQVIPYIPFEIHHKNGRLTVKTRFGFAERKST